MESFIEILEKLGVKNTISSSPYDTAWIARLKNIEPEMSNQALEWICSNQLPDGSWGAGFPMYYHDRVICTLSSMIVLKSWGRRQLDKLRVQNGLEALDQIVAGAEQGLKADFNGATVGFEMIVPLLVAEAEELGIIKQQKEKILGSLTHLRKIKLDKLKGIKFSRHITIAHSAEMTGQDKLDLLDIENLQEKNGSVGNSPSATAHFALHVKTGDQNALDYLRPIVHSRHGGAPTLSPIEIFERVWVLWNLSLTNLYRENKQIKQLCDLHLDYLEKYWKPGQGLGFSESFTPTDADDTSVGYEILSKFGRQGDLDAVLHFEEEKWFRCFHFEANPSVDVNIHVLGALRQAGFERDHPSVQKAMNFIYSMKQAGNYWYDKWNVSPFYTTAHLIMQCKEYDRELCQLAVDWILENQKPDGAWGFYNTSTAEETAYCIQALVIWQRYTGSSLMEKINQAYDWLIRNCEPPYPPLWIDKSLYCPEVLVKSSIVSALVLVEEEA